MAKSETYTLPSAIDALAVVDALAPADCMGGRRYRGCVVLLDGAAVTLRGGNNADRSFFGQDARRVLAGAMPGEPMATARQLAYLAHLVERDPGMATTLGASRDGSTVTPNLTRRGASALIDLLLSQEA